MHRFAIEPQVVIPVLAQVDIGALECQVTVRAITGIHLVTVVIVPQCAVIQFNAGNTSAQIQTFVIASGQCLKRQE
ncbi:hypothetical protein D9M73_245890 [compost metagenome]